MTLMPRKLIAQQGSDAKVPAEDLRLALAALFAPASAANAARSGVLRGSGASGFTACQVLSTVASQLTVKQGAFIVQQATTNGGAYIGVIDSDQTLTLTPPSAGNFKAGFVIAHCYDEAYGDTQDGFALEVLLGAQATTAAGAAYPALPTNSLALGGFTVDGTGAITITTAPLYTGTHNGILPVMAGDTGAGIYDGQYRDEPNLGLQRWSSSGAAWARPYAQYLGAGTAFPSAARTGDLYARTDVGGGALFVLTLSGWQLAEEVRVADRAARDALNTGLLSGGDRVSTAAGDLWIWTGNGWSYPAKNTVLITGAPGATWNAGSLAGGAQLTSAYRVPFTVTSPANTALFTVASSAMTCVQAGTYLVGGQVNVNTNTQATAGSQRVAVIYNNGVQVPILSPGNQMPANTHSYACLSPGAPVHLAVGDVLELRFLQDSGSTQPVELDASYLFAQFLTV